MNKVIRDGKVAILYSPGYGAGWWTWNRSDKEGGDQLIFCPELVAMVEAKVGGDEIAKRAKELFPNAYCGGADELEIEWVPQGTSFYIDEYDGNESVITPDDSNRWKIA